MGRTMTPESHLVSLRWVRRISRMLMAVAAMSAAQLQALGLGDIEVYSAINEPFSAEIGLTNLGGVQENELLVALGGVSDYENAGVSSEFTHSDLSFDVDLSVPGNPLVRVSSSRPIKEPYLNFLVQARWPAGRLLREFTVLLDFPAFSGDSPQSLSQPEPAAAAVAPAPAPRQQPAAQAAPMPAPNRPVAAVPALPRIAERVDGYRVQTGDTLWSIGGQIAADLGVSRSQAMLAIRDANPEAFIDSNLNQLKAGSVIRMPSRAEATRRSADQASEQFTAEINGAQPQVTPLQSTPADFRDDASGAAAEPQFRLASVDDANAQAGGSGQVEEIQAENQRLADINATLQDELEAVEVENDDLRARLANLEEQVELMEALVEVESQTGAQVQQALTEPETTQPVATPVVASQVREETLLDRVMGWLPILGLVLVGLLVGAYLIVRRRQAGDDSDSEEYLEEEYDESAAVLEETAAVESATFEDDTDDELDTELSDFEDVARMAEEEGLADEVSQPQAEGEELADVTAEAEEDDWDSDFDDLDAFFSDSDADGESTTVSAESDESDELLTENEDDEDAPQEEAEEPSEPRAEDSNDLTFDSADLNSDTDEASDTAAELPEDADSEDGLDLNSVVEDIADESDETDADTATEGSDNEADELDDWQTGLDEDFDDILGEETGSDEAGTDAIDSVEGELDDLEALLDSVENAEDSPEEGVDSATSTTTTADPAAESDLHDDEFDSLLQGFDSELDDEFSSDVEGDTADECETKLELAEAYIEMGDSSGASELLSEIENEGGEKYADRVAELRGRLES